ncbi:MAG TPA: ABC transporter substrate-binding protein, partial [Pyrinomonadaceae bacterium]|nr:ABC transporter substrate-binding protein [Pyrinomonadaceae bacterium]
MENGKWKMENGKRIFSRYPLSVIRYPFFLCLCGLVFLSACNELEKPKTEPFYAETAPPPKQEFRWSNGKMPKSFDPAAASAPPETDIVRAVYDGLTDVDPKTLEPVPAIAARWTASEDFKTWTFHLRRDAKWSNGESVTAKDFVRSWQRLASLGEKVQQRKLLKNIIGMDTENVLPVFAGEEIDISAGSTNPAGRLLTQSLQTNGNINAATPAPQRANPEEKKAETETKTEPKPEKEAVKFGVEAVDNYTLKVSLVRPDRDFPALVAHPIFRPIYGDGREFETAELNANIFTNGAFRIFSVGRDGVTLDRAEYYWNKAEINLERVRFVPTDSAETALEGYRAGEIDAITNANFEPLALKLLTPYDDFRRTKHSALNFYEFNLKNYPLGDRRVREALAIAVERERLTEDEMDGATEPALNYLPFRPEPKLAQDVERAQSLLAEAGFPDGENFPVVRLLI